MHVLVIVIMAVILVEMGADAEADARRRTAELYRPDGKKGLAELFSRGPPGAGRGLNNLSY